MAHTALITGSTSGIGHGIAKALSQKGYSVIITGSRTETEAQTAIDDIKRDATKAVCYVQANLKTTEGMLRLCSEVDKLCSEGVDILVNNAGMQHVTLVEECSLEKWNDLMQINLTAPFYLTRHFVPRMKEKGFRNEASINEPETARAVGMLQEGQVQKAEAAYFNVTQSVISRLWNRFLYTVFLSFNLGWGRIVNVSSRMGLVASAKKSPYCASKHGLVGMTKAVALETAPYGITCNAVCPGWVDTDFVASQVEDAAKKLNISIDDAKVKLMCDSQPTGKPVQVSQLADLVLFLCSPGGDSMTGTALVMDGGTIAK